MCVLYCTLVNKKLHLGPVTEQNCTKSVTVLVTNMESDIIPYKHTPLLLKLTR